VEYEFRLSNSNIPSALIISSDEGSLCRRSALSSYSADALGENKGDILALSKTLC
jgi:hypothetical protein